MIRDLTYTPLIADINGMSGGTNSLLTALQQHQSAMPMQAAASAPSAPASAAPGMPHAGGYLGSGSYSGMGQGLQAAGAFPNVSYGSAPHLSFGQRLTEMLLPGRQYTDGQFNGAGSVWRGVGQLATGVPLATGFDLYRRIRERTQSKEHTP